MKPVKQHRIFTKDRAEKLARSMEAAGMTVRRTDSENVLHHRMADDFLIACRVYAEVWNGRHMVLRITHESIDVRSVIL